MGILHRKTTFLLLNILFLIAGVIAFVLFMPSLGTVDLEAHALVATAVIVALFFGLRGGLITTLVILFLFGSLYFWNLLIRPQEDFLLFNDSSLFIFGVSIVGLTVLTGSIHDQIKGFQVTNSQLSQQVHDLVAVDAETGFDNEERFQLDLQMEMDRIKRHGGIFTVLLLRIDYLSTFYDLYGETEYNRFIRFFRQQLYESTRATDKKFRLSQEDFAFILPHTAEENMEILYHRFKDIIGDFELERGKVVTFSNHVAHYTISEDTKVIEPKEVLILLRNELKSNAL
ncbi:diguanylate cyclase domain-containing protein [Exiguobacterium algae]|uniref:diguanylate cyclase domain-containing protein n=1 Tax=Exiguobacterium algae TaxID=2751250 RepID=UPI001BE895A1|nr:GGDEF domain-containing protein [Exiguobacterium algae]